MIREYCRAHGQAVPDTPGEVTRCILESLALLYAVRMEELERVTGRALRRIHVVGGGSRNTLLNQFTADATGREVIAGPVEATAIGNVLVQAIATGHLPDLAAARALVARSFPTDKFLPISSDEWAAARERFADLRTDR
jgi:rhamnulokinase